MPFLFNNLYIFKYVNDFLGSKNIFSIESINNNILKCIENKHFTNNGKFITQDRYNKVF